MDTHHNESMDVLEHGQIIHSVEAVGLDRTSKAGVSTLLDHGTRDGGKDAFNLPDLTKAHQRLEVTSFLAKDQDHCSRNGVWLQSGEAVVCRMERLDMNPHGAEKAVQLADFHVPASDTALVLYRSSRWRPN